jgi:hypothetical protein
VTKMRDQLGDFALELVTSFPFRVALQRPIVDQV